MRCHAGLFKPLGDGELALVIRLLGSGTFSLL